MSPLIYVLIGVGAAILIGVIISRRSAARRKAARDRQQLLNGANVTNDVSGVGPGGVLRVPAFGPNATDRETHVTARHRYVDDENAYYELVCEDGARTLLLQHGHEDGELYVSAAYEDQNPSLGELGLTGGVLSDFGDREAGDFEWDGVRWRYEYSCEAFFYEDAGRQREGFYQWSFTDRGETRYVSVEKWADERDFQVYLRWSIDPEDIEVYSAGEES